MPTVSIIIPAHNAARHLEQTLDSVYAQTFADWEIVAVDDGSDDGTYDILSTAGARVNALRSQVAQGPAAARNRALEAARGDLVAFLDADDMLAPRYLERQIDCLSAARASGRKVGLVACDARILDDHGFADHTYLEMVPGPAGPLTLDRVLARNPIYISALVTAQAGRDAGWFDEELFGTEDFGLWLKILELGYEAILNPEPLAVYRRAAGSVSSNIRRQGLNNRLAYGLALSRGRLDRRQQLIAEDAIRYNLAMEAVAELRFAGARPRTVLELLRRAPLLTRVALTHRDLWRQWLAVLRTGRQVVAGPRGRR